MNKIIKINDEIFRVTCPYKDIFTTMYVMKTQKGAILFDAASYANDVEDYVLPLLKTAGVKKDELKYVFISHAHGDHAGGLAHLVEVFPDITILSRSQSLAESYKSSKVIAPDEGEVFLDAFRVVAIPGHTNDSAALYDMRSKILITGDCLQLFGIYGSGNWMANIGYVEEYLEAIEKLRSMDISAVCTAHDYHPYGWKYSGNEAISKALDACIEPLDMIARLIEQNKGADNETICSIFNAPQKLPKVGMGVVSAMRKTMEKGYAIKL